MFAVLAASCQGFVAVRSVTPRTLPLPSLPRAAAPQANLFDSLGKIAEYNKKYWGTMAAGMMDGRTARASHVLFGYAKYEKDGEQRAADLKLALDSGEITFADAAKEFSTCPSAAKGGDLGTFKRGAMVPEFDSTVFSEETPLGSMSYAWLGAICGPIKTQFGYHLLQVVERSEKSA